MAENIPEEYLNELKDAFINFDKDGDGFIQASDLGNPYNKYI
jgi:Ca2+-binding EF-hand superfamily protein